MVTSLPVIQNLEELRDYVSHTICQHSQLEVGAFPLTERILIRASRPCGIYFCLHGPRAVLYTAIWETQHNTVLFYDCSGTRFGKVQLVAAVRLELEMVAA